MRGSWSRWIGVLVAVSCVSACSESDAPKREVDAGLVAVEKAVTASVPGAGAVSHAGRFSENLPGDGAGGGGGTVTGALTRTARFDWSPLIASAQFGVAGLVVDLADAEAAVLRGYGFEPFDSGASVSDSAGAPDEFVVVNAGSNRTGGWSAPRDVDRLTYRRLYRAPGTGAFVVSRIDYDGRDHTVLVEMTYVEATVDAKYPAVNAKFSETVSRMPRKR